MAQTKVTNFYATKRRGNIQSSGKRKLPATILDEGTACMYGNASLSFTKETVCDLKKGSSSHIAVKPTSLKKPKTWDEKEKKKESPVSNKQKKAINRSNKKKGRVRTEKCHQGHFDAQDIRLAFRNHLGTNEHAEDQIKTQQKKLFLIDETIPEQTPNISENTGSQALKTPSKRGSSDYRIDTPSKRQRRKDEINDNRYCDPVTPDSKDNDAVVFRKAPRSARKHLLLKDSVSDNIAPLHSSESKIQMEQASVTLPNDKLQVDSLIKECLSSVQKSNCDASDKEVYNILSVMKQVPTPISSIPNSPTSPTKPMSTPSISELPSTVKKLTPEQVREKLQHCGKLTELKEKLSQIKSFTARFKESKPRLSDVAADTKPVPQNSCLSQNKKAAEEKPRPAYERFHNLATSTTPSLTIPYRYKLLSETFHCCDIVVSILHNRQEVCTFDKLKKSVEDMMKRAFDKLKLGQIKTVFPLAYIFSQEKDIKRFVCNKPRSSKYQLVISPNFDYTKKDSEKYSVDSLETEITNTSLTSSKQCSSQMTKTMPPSCLIERRAIFSSNLLELVKQHHQKYLSSLTPSVVVPNSSLTRWHPRFPLDEVPDVISSPLPEPPDSQKCSTAHDVLQKVRGTVGEKVEQALESVANMHASHQEKPESTQKLAANSKINTGVLKGISQDLLQKIRAREAANLVKEMTRSPAQEKRLEMMSSLPEMVRILRTYFITERRAAVSMEDAIQKIVDSYHSPITPEEVQDHLKLAAEILPNWIFLISIRKGLFIKIDKNAELHQVIEKITNIIKSPA